MAIIIDGQSISIPDLVNAARNDGLITRWIDEYVPGVIVSTVLQVGPSGESPGIYYNLSPGERIMAVRLFYQVDTDNDECRFYAGATTAANGGGTFIPSTPGVRVVTAVTPQSSSAFFDLQTPDSAGHYSDGVRSVTIRVTPASVNTKITILYSLMSELDI